jgi:hypothetical protein
MKTKKRKMRMKIRTNPLHLHHLNPLLINLHLHHLNPLLINLHHLHLNHLPNTILLPNHHKKL